MFWALDYLVLVLILGAGVLVVRLRNLNGATIALSAVGTQLALLFVVLGAPDVAHSEIVVGAIALPVLYFIAIGDVPARQLRGSGPGGRAEQHRRRGVRAVGQRHHQQVCRGLHQRQPHDDLD